METDKNYFLVGLFAIIIILAGFGFTLWLTAAGQGPTAEYRIRFSESVGGLKTGSMVKFHGVDVGTVKRMTIDLEHPDLTQVDISVLASTPVKADTTASLKLLGVSGDVYVELTGGSPGMPNLAQTAKEGAPPEIRATESSLSAVMDRLPQITEKANTLLEKLNHTADQINKIFSDRNVKAINGVVQTLGKHYGDQESQKNP